MKRYQIETLIDAPRPFWRSTNQTDDLDVAKADARWLERHSGKPYRVRDTERTSLKTVGGPNWEMRQ